MQHLNYLKIINIVMGALMLLAFLAMIGGAIVPFAMGAPSDTALPVAIGMGVGGIFILVVAILFFVAAGKVAQGRGRILQTILAVVQLGNFPVGTAVGGYAIWVCWINEETKNMFV